MDHFMEELRREQEAHDRRTAEFEKHPNESRSQLQNYQTEKGATILDDREGAVEEDEEDWEEEYVVLDLDDVFHGAPVPNFSYTLSGLDTLNPILTFDNGLKLIGRYVETIGSVVVYSEKEKDVFEAQADTRELPIPADPYAVNTVKKPLKRIRGVCKLERKLKFCAMPIEHAPVTNGMFMQSAFVQNPTMQMVGNAMTQMAGNATMQMAEDATHVNNTMSVEDTAHVINIVPVEAALHARYVYNVLLLARAQRFFRFAAAVVAGFCWRRLSLKSSASPPDLGVYIEGRLKRMPPSKGEIGKKVTPFSLPVAIDIMYQVAQAVRYLHDRHLAHRDLKPSSILVKEREDTGLTSVAGEGCLDIKLADFGLGKVYDNTSTTHGHTVNTCTAIYGALEIFGKDHALERMLLPMVDVWSFGIRCAEILSGERPFYDEPRMTFQTRIFRECLGPTLPKNCHQYLAFWILDNVSFLKSIRMRFSSQSNSYPFLFIICPAVILSVQCCRHGVYGVCFQPNGGHVVVAAFYDFTAKLWDSRVGRRRANSEGHFEDVIDADIED